VKRDAARRRLEHRAEKQTTKRMLSVPIERIVPGGMGIGHAERMTVLAPFTAPGDTARIAIDRVRGNTAFGSLVEVIEPGPERTEAPCPHFGLCGGCDLQHLSYRAQLRAKQEIVKDCFRRIGGITIDEIEIVASPRAWGYRIRAEWAVDPSKNAMGYHLRGSNEVLDIETCPILDPALESARVVLHAKVENGSLVVEGSIHGATSEGVVGIVPKSDEFPAVLLTTTINGERYGFDAACFFQANESILPQFVAYVIDQATGGEQEQAGEAVDLYCGVGLFTVPLARRFAHVIGVENHARSASIAHENAKAAALANVTISGLPVEQWVRRRGLHGEKPRVMVMDPPRLGLEPEVVAHLNQIGCERLVYVSCDPATLARDVKAFTSGGYELAAVRAFDMFPQSHHVEVVATLTQSHSG
jgi:23S rRNA (uracil1939-C5)-methyltransferase